MAQPHDLSYLSAVFKESAPPIHETEPLGSDARNQGAPLGASWAVERRYAGEINCQNTQVPKHTPK